ncbi:MAG: universal stress protein [Cyclobacteriaceae bacterium]|nr:universal stress protein [Cyclobacteriaceae bacterium]MDH4296417.1 universal stress protein [Cyclobacteriaceae bacterium]MDH5248838.1 universal stress protein [Cyclobacteriaceae bacterium]
MKNILVPCDFSEPSVDAFRVAINIALKAKAIVHLINVIELPVMYDTLLMPVLNFEAAMMEEVKEKTENELKKLIGKYHAESVKVIADLQFGAPAPKILEYAQTKSIDIIIMGSHGAQGFREFMIGSNAEKIVRGSTVPVLVVKAYTEGPIENIVFPNTLDTERQEDLVNKVKDLQNFFNAKLHIVYINTPLHFTADNITYARLADFADRYGIENYTANVYNHPDEEEGIIQFADKVRGDLIAIGTHGRKGIAHLVSGSLAEDVTNHTDKLIWTYSLRNKGEKA